MAGHSNRGPPRPFEPVAEELLHRVCASSWSWRAAGTVPWMRCVLRASKPGTRSPSHWNPRTRTGRGSKNSGSRQLAHGALQLPVSAGAETGAVSAGVAASGTVEQENTVRFCGRGRGRGRGRGWEWHWRGTGRPVTFDGVRPRSALPSGRSRGEPVREPLGRARSSPARGLASARSPPITHDHTVVEPAGGHDGRRCRTKPSETQACDGAAGAFGRYTVIWVSKLAVRPDSLESFR